MKITFEEMTFQIKMSAIIMYQNIEAMITVRNL